MDHGTTAVTRHQSLLLSLADQSYNFPAPFSSDLRPGPGPALGSSHDMRPMAPLAATINPDTFGKYELSGNDFSHPNLKITMFSWNTNNLDLYTDTVRCR